MDDLTIANLAQTLRRVTHNCWLATLIGNAPPATEKLRQRMKSLSIGDLVIEISTIYQSRGTSDIDAVGYLERISQEPAFADWDELAEGEPCPTETAYYIKLFDGRSFRWTNANFISCPVWLEIA